MQSIERSNYYTKLVRLIGSTDIKVLTGVRRAGKSFLLRSFMNFLKKEKKNNIIFIDFFDLKFDQICNYNALYNYVEKKYQKGKHNFLCVDEVQLCPQFERAINSLHNSGKYDIYLTGSNAILLSSDLATLFTGRFIEIHVLPFSFYEFCKYHKKEKNAEILLQNYVETGGLAGCYQYTETNDRYQYIRDVYNTIVTKDLVARGEVKDGLVLRHLSDFMLDNISNLTSTAKITNTLKADNIKTNHITIRHYIELLSNAYLFYPVRRYDLHGKRYLATSEKYYCVDIGFRTALLGRRNFDYGRVLENIVALELMRRGYEIYVGVLYKTEIDFVALRQNEKIYIQVTENLHDQSTLKREIEPLLKIKDAYPKIIIARTLQKEYDIEGVRVIDLTEWLLGAN